jgi:NitT/TauT family transport system substrate-binding protein
MYLATKSSARQVGTLAAITVAVAIVLAGCGNNGAPSSQSTTPKGTTASLGTVQIAVASLTALPTLPLQLAVNRGLFKKYGVDAHIDLTGSGSKALTAQLAGEVDVTASFYEQTIQVAAKGKALTSFVELSTMPGYALVVTKKGLGHIHTAADLVGSTVGVSAPGSAGSFFVDYLLAKAGKNTGAASFVGIGIGASAVAAVEQNTVDAAVLYDPDVSQVVAMGPSLRVIADGRDPGQAQAIFGASQYPSMSLFAGSSWIGQHPQIVQALTDAIAEADRYLHTASLADIVANLRSESVGTDKAAFEKILAETVPYISTDGRIDPTGANAVLHVQSVASADIAHANIDLSSTYTNKFVK